MFLQNLRAKVGARLSGDKESGFTLIELLVVMLILGILAAIAIPAFFSQKDKANDASAKAMVRSAQTATETYATDHGGSYAGVDEAGIKAIEETIIITADTKDAEDVYLSAVTGSANEYELTVSSPRTENTFTIARASNGTVSYTCEDPGNGGCPDGGNWDG